MTFLEAIELVKNRIDETDADEQIVSIVKNAINRAYFEIKTRVIPDVDTYEIEIENGVGDLPFDFYQIDYMPFMLGRNERIIGKKIFLNRDGLYNISYIKTPNELEEDDDEITLPYSLAYSCTTFGCYAYYMHRKKDSLSRGYRDEYLGDLALYQDEGANEIVIDIDGDFYG